MWAVALGWPALLFLITARAWDWAPAPVSGAALGAAGCAALAFLVLRDGVDEEVAASAARSGPLWTAASVSFSAAFGLGIWALAGRAFAPGAGP